MGGPGFNETIMELENVNQMVGIFQQMPKTPESSGALSRLYATRDKLVRRVIMWYFLEAVPGYIAEIDRLRKEHGV